MNQFTASKMSPIRENNDEASAANMPSAGHNNAEANSNSNNAEAGSESDNAEASTSSDFPEASSPIGSPAVPEAGTETGAGAGTGDNAGPSAIAGPSAFIQPITPSMPQRNFSGPSSRPTLSHDTMMSRYSASYREHSSKGKRPMRQLNAEQKLNAIYRISKGESKASVARDIMVPESTLRGWCKNEGKLSKIVICTFLSNKTNNMRNFLTKIIFDEHLENLMQKPTGIFQLQPPSEKDIGELIISEEFRAEMKILVKMGRLQPNFSNFSLEKFLTAWEAKGFFSLLHFDLNKYIQMELPKTEEVKVDQPELLENSNHITGPYDFSSVCEPKRNSPLPVLPTLPALEAIVNMNQLANLQQLIQPQSTLSQIANHMNLMNQFSNSCLMANMSAFGGDDPNALRFNGTTSCNVRQTTSVGPRSDGSNAKNSSKHIAKQADIGDMNIFNKFLKANTSAPAEADPLSFLLRQQEKVMKTYKKKNNVTSTITSSMLAALNTNNTPYVPPTAPFALSATPFTPFSTPLSTPTQTLTPTPADVNKTPVFLNQFYDMFNNSILSKLRNGNGDPHAIPSTSAESEAAHTIRQQSQTEATETPILYSTLMPERPSHSSESSESSATELDFTNNNVKKVEANLQPEDLTKSQKPGKSSSTSPLDHSICKKMETNGVKVEPGNETEGSTSADDADSNAAKAIEHAEQFEKWLSTASYPCISCSQVQAFRHLLSTIKTTLKRKAENATPNSERKRRRK